MSHPKAIKPDASEYVSHIEIAKNVQERLYKTTSRHASLDDVYDFVKRTLSTVDLNNPFVAHKGTKRLEEELLKKFLKTDTDTLFRALKKNEKVTIKIKTIYGEEFVLEDSLLLDARTYKSGFNTKLCYVRFVNTKRDEIWTIGTEQALTIERKRDNYSSLREGNFATEIIMERGESNA